MDLSCAEVMAKQLREAQASALLVAVDLRELEFIDVDRMLETAGMHEMFEVVDVRASELA